MISYQPFRHRRIYFAGGGELLGGGLRFACLLQKHGVSRPQKDGTRKDPDGLGQAVLGGWQIARELLILCQDRIRDRDAQPPIDRFSEKAGSRIVVIVFGVAGGAVIICGRVAGVDLY